MSNFVYQLSEDSDFLMHHGIKGQKWGVQNGPPYPLNPSKDYSKAEQKANAKILAKEYKKDIVELHKINIKDIDLSDDNKINQYVDNVVGKYGNIKISKYSKLRDKIKLDINSQLKEIEHNKLMNELKEISKKNKIDDQDLLTYDKLSKDSNRATKAADIGIKALNKMYKYGYDTNNEKEWFLYEDQTIGLPQIADLVNQGKSKKQIQSIIGQALDHYEDDYYNDKYFNFIEGSGNDIHGFDKFIDACIEVKESNDQPSEWNDYLNK